MILCKEKYAKDIDRAVFPGNQGGPLMHVIAGKAVCFKEAMEPSFKKYAEQVVKNAAAMAEGFNENGVNLVSGGTDNHLMLLDLRSNGVTGKALETMLGDANITVNKNAIPFDPEKPAITSGIRVGTPAATTRGMDETTMKRVAYLISDIIKNGTDACDRVKQEVLEITAKYPLYSDCVLK